METTNQTMGLNEILNGLNATSEDNGIDVHMMLPTEYGAVAILSASGYGNPKKLRDETNPQKRTTTGNSTGVYFTGDRWELLACKSTDSSKYLNNNFTGKGSCFIFLGPNGWHEGSFSNNIRSTVPNNSIAYRIIDMYGCVCRRDGNTQLWINRRWQV